MQTLRIIITLSHRYGDPYMMLSEKLFSRCPISKTKLLNGTETSFRRALISNNCHTCVKQRIVGKEKK